MDKDLFAAVISKVSAREYTDSLGEDIEILSKELEASSTTSQTPRDFSMARIKVKYSNKKGKQPGKPFKRYRRSSPYTEDNSPHQCQDRVYQTAFMVVSHQILNNS